MASFWETMGPGLLGVGADIYGEQSKARANKKLLQQARGPLYEQQQRLAGQSLSRAEGMDPKAMAAERFAAQQALVEPSNEAERQKLMRALQSQGLLGLASHGAVPGVTTTSGQAVNPYMASLLAAQATAKNRAAYESLAEGEGYLDRLINRGGAAQGQAQRAQQSGIGAVQAGVMQSKPKITDTLLKSGLKILQDPKASSTIWDLLGKGAGMLGGYLGIGGGSTPQPTYYSAPSYDPVSERHYSPEDYYNVWS